MYYYEVDLGAQTMGFHPTDYVDITSVREKKKAALFAHKSQHGERIYSAYHQVMENYRGRESGCNAAEGFVHLARVTAATRLPGVRIPPAVLARFDGLSESAFAAESLALAAETIRAVAELPGAAGVHVLAPYWEEQIPPLLAAAGVAARTARP